MILISMQASSDFMKAYGAHHIAFIEFNLCYAGVNQFFVCLVGFRR